MSMYNIDPKHWYAALLFVQDHLFVRTHELAEALGVTVPTANKILEMLGSVLPDRGIRLAGNGRGRPSKVLQPTDRKPLYPTTAQIIADAKQNLLTPRMRELLAFIEDKDTITAIMITRLFDGLSNSRSLVYLRRIVALYPDQWREVPILGEKGAPCVGIVRKTAS